MPYKDTGTFIFVSKTLCPQINTIVLILIYGDFNDALQYNAARQARQLLVPFLKSLV